MIILSRHFSKRRKVRIRGWSGFPVIAIGDSSEPLTQMYYTTEWLLLILFKRDMQFVPFVV
jgi:hypothetical protein